jgi:hypothetical protein
VAGLGVALNESSLLDVRFDLVHNRAELEVDVLTLPVEGPEPEDCRFVLSLHEISRVVFVAADATGPLTLEQVSEPIRRHAGRPMYGWQFVDTDRPTPDPPSFEWRGSSPQLSAHRLYVFQGEGLTELAVFFDRLDLRRFAGEPLPFAEFVAGGKRWWDALDAGDPRIANRGILPLG